MQSTKNIVDSTQLIIFNNSDIKNSVYIYSQYELSLHNFINYYVHDLIGAIIFTLGIIFNILSFTYFQLSHSFRDTSMRYYFSVISITDSLRLLEWPAIVLVDKKFINLSAHFCKALIFLTNLSGLISIWLIVFLSIERYIILECPFHGKHFYKIKNSIRLLIFVLILILLLNVPYLLPGIVRDSYTNYDIHIYMCNINVNYHVYMFINTVILYAFVPFIILFIFNCLIISVLARQKNQALLFVRNSNTINLKRERQFKEKTVLLIIISCFLIITVSPRYILQMIMFLFQFQNLKLFAVTKCFIILEMFNFSFNFFFYIICSKTSRKELYLIAYYFLYYKWTTKRGVDQQISTSKTNLNTVESKSKTKRLCSKLLCFCCNKNNNRDQCITSKIVKPTLYDTRKYFVKAHLNSVIDSSDTLPVPLETELKPVRLLSQFDYRNTNTNTNTNHQQYKCRRFNSVTTTPSLLRDNSIKDENDSVRSMREIKEMKEAYGSRYFNVSQRSLEVFLLRQSSISSRNRLKKQALMNSARKRTLT